MFKKFLGVIRFILSGIKSPNRHYSGKKAKPLNIVQEKKGDVMNSAEKMIVHMQSSKEIAMNYIMRFVGIFYSWGGDDPSGFDCSGLAVEYLKVAGLIKRKSDYGANALWEHFKKERVKKPYRGCLVFYWNAQKTYIMHIEIMLNGTITLGASGGGSKTKTREDAIKHNAFIKCRPYDSISRVAGFADPWLIKD